MLTFDECKAIADKKAAEYGVDIDGAYKIGNDYAFENKSQEWAGVFPFVVESESGVVCGLWEYLIKENKTMDDMQDVA